MLSVATRAARAGRARRGGGAAAALRLGGRGARPRGRARRGGLADIPRWRAAAHRRGAGRPGGARARACGARRSSLGVRLYERTPVLDAELRTPGGRVRADRVLLATGAYPPLTRSIRRLVAPVYDYVDRHRAAERRAAPRDRLGARARASPTAATASTTTGSRPTVAILFGGYEAVYRFGNRVDDRRLTRHARRPTAARPAPARDLPGARGHRHHARLGRADRHLQPLLRHLRPRARRPRGLRGRLHRPRRRRVAVRRPHGARPARRRRHRAHAPQARAHAPAAVPARAGPLGGHPGHPPRAGARRRARRPPRPVAAAARPARARLRQLGTNFGWVGRRGRRPGRVWRVPDICQSGASPRHMPVRRQGRRAADSLAPHPAAVDVRIAPRM